MDPTFIAIIVLGSLHLIEGRVVDLSAKSNEAGRRLFADEIALDQGKRGAGQNDKSDKRTDSQSDSFSWIHLLNQKKSLSNEERKRLYEELMREQDVSTAQVNGLKREEMQDKESSRDFKIREF